MTRHFRLTKDGLLLNQINVERIEFEKELKFTKKQFEQRMFPLELAEIEQDNLKANSALKQMTIHSV